MAGVSNREAELVRALVAGWDAKTIRALAKAATVYAGTLDVTDGLFPDPEMRAVADDLRDVAEVLARANQVRKWIEEKG